MSDPLQARELDWQAELADMQRSLAYYEKRDASLVEGVCLLGDILMTLYPNHTSIGSGGDWREEAAKPLKDVIQGAWFLMAGHDHSTREWSDGTALNADALRDALAHPVIAALIDAWATKDG